MKYCNSCMAFRPEKYEDCPVPGCGMPLVEREAPDKTPTPFPDLHRTPTEPGSKEVAAGGQGSHGELRVIQPGSGRKMFLQKLQELKGDKDVA